MALARFFKLPNSLQTYFCITDFRSQPPDITQAVVLLLKQTASDFFAHQPQGCARFFQTFAGFVHWRVVGLFLAFGNGDRPLDLLPANPAKVLTQSFAMLQLVAHG